MVSRLIRGCKRIVGHAVFEIKVFRKSLFSFSATFLLLVILVGCNDHYTPKPKGYYRISFPKHDYAELNGDYPYNFELPTYTKIEIDKAANAEAYWINIDYPEYKGKIHISYKVVDHNIAEILEDSRKLAYKHSIKADAIGEKLFTDPEKNVYGILYNIEGDAASSIQFFVTDSIRNFLRGSLYFNAVPNKDSLAPVVNFVKEDVIHIMETFEWRSVTKH